MDRAERKQDHMRKYFDFGDHAQGRIVDPIDFTAIRGARIVTGIVTTIYPEAPRVVGIMTTDGEPYTIRVRAA